MNYEPDAVTLGDGARGRVVFEGKGDCMRCHRVKGQGPRVAPELTAIGTMRAPSALRRSVLDPTGSMRPINRPVQLVTAGGTRIVGRRLKRGHLHRAAHRRAGAPAVVRQGGPS